MFLKIGNDSFVRWENVEAVSFKRKNGTLLACLLILASGKQIQIKGDYAISVWEKMFPTKVPHDIL